MTVRLSKTQEEVVALMRQGWELGVSASFDHTTWLQKGGVGKGGPTKRVSGATVHALWKKKIIDVLKHEFPTTRYRLITDNSSFMEKWEKIIKS